MEDDHSALTALLREEERLCDEGFVHIVDWLIGLDVDLAARRRDAVRRWSIDLGSALSVGAASYVIIPNASGIALDNHSLLSVPILIAALVPALWLFTRSQSLAP